MNQKEGGIPKVIRERDIERIFRPRFQEYEEWRASQEEGISSTEEAAPKPEKKKSGLTRWDLLFVGLGFLVAILWRGCSTAK